MSDIIILNGLAWDKENLSVNGKTYFTYQEAIEESSKLGKRLPTKEEFEELLKLPHTWDLTNNGLLVAQKADDLRTNESLLFKSLGYICCGSMHLDYGAGGYWSSSLDNGMFAFYLEFYNSFIRMNSNILSLKFTVRCVSDIKQETMKENQEIEFKIPEGYVIDSIKSTENKIVCKPIATKYPKSWEEAFAFRVIEGFYVEGSSVEHAGHGRCTIEDKSVLKTEKQAKSALAYAQLTQLMALPCHNGDWVPDWDDPNQDRCCIARLKHGITQLDFSGYFNFLTFKSEKVRDVFLDNHIDLIKQFYQL